MQSETSDAKESIISISLNLEHPYSTQMPWAAKIILIMLLLTKMSITFVNAWNYDCMQYDILHHTHRARTLGLTADKMAYNPPLYYFPGVFFDEEIRSNEEQLPREKLLRFLRFPNAIYLFVFYLCWIFFIFPALTKNWRSSFLASLVLLALPGYQKLAVMVHPDNLLCMATALTFSVWLWVNHKSKIPNDERSPIQRVAPYMMLIFCIALTSLTRPFAAVPVFIFSMGLAYLFKKGNPWRSRSFLLPFFGAGIFLFLVSTSWYVYRWSSSGQVLNAYNTNYINAFKPYQKDFDFTHYFTSFYFRELLTIPNRNIFLLQNDPWGENLKQTKKKWRKIPRAKKKSLKAKNPLMNSFFTTLYSEVWGDHWLYFSSTKRNRDLKVRYKQVAFVTALPITLMLIFSLFKNSFRSWRLFIQKKKITDVPWLLTFSMLIFGSALYLYWQTGDALLPGKNSTIKFIYLSYLAPFPIALSFSHASSKKSLIVGSVLLTLLFVVTLPIAIFFPD